MLPHPEARRSIRALDAVPLVETLAFVGPHLCGVGQAGDAARVLEVGCGDGDLAAALGRAGHRVLALDASEDAVARARQRGARAVQARWPDFEHDPVDAILFTRSLHHLEPLAPALDRAGALLLPGGLLLVEEIAFEEVDDATVAWFRGKLGRLADAALLDAADDATFAGRFMAGGGDLQAWRREHPHDLHSAETMRREIGARFDLLQARPAPYLYRYLAAALERTRRGFDALRGFLGDEARQVREGRLTPVGRRFVARNRWRPSTRRPNFGD